MSNSSFYSNTGITSADVSSITSAKEAAATSETNAATSATNAATSSTNAATSATNAATSETNASNSAATATTSAANASTSETNASASAATATTQASNAATSATAAAGSASTAGTSATNAASSATNAATSETNAATSATNAATSATSASTSATNAGTSETNAAASASSASGYVTSATTQANNAATSATAAATSETNAASSATAASTSASGASTSASNANTSATNAASSASQAATSAAAAALAADNFDDTYLGSNASDPTTDNDGDALNAGDLHFNTSSNTLKVYNGSAWQDAAIDSSGFVQTTGDTMTGVLAFASGQTFDGRDVSADGTKLDTIETNADVTDTTNVTAAGALMDSELTNIAAVKALNQGLATTDEPSFDNTTLNAIAATISDTAVDIFVYDTRKDSDGGAWRKRTQHTSWYNETLNTATRGSRKEFPAVAVIVAESNKVTIYDGDDPDLPMWTSFSGSHWLANSNMTSVVMKNGILAVGNSPYGLREFNFIKELALVRQTSNVYTAVSNAFNDHTSEPSTTSTSVGTIVNREVNDVAMTVLPNAPIDAATGLPVPTIAVATNGGVSVIKDDGTVAEPTSQTSYENVDIIGSRCWFSVSGTSSSPVRFIDLETFQDGDAIPFSYTWPSLSGTPHAFSNYTRSHTTVLPDGLAIKDDQNLLLQVFSGPETGYTSGNLTRLLTSTYNTGWMNGDIKLATLSDTDDTNVTGSELVTNGTFDTDTTGWTQAYVSVAPTTFSSVSGQLVARRGDQYRFCLQQLTVEVGKTYTVSVDSPTGDNLMVGKDSNSNQYGFIQTGAAGTGSVTFTATQTALYIMCHTYKSQTTDVIFDNISVRLAEEDRSVNGNGLQVFGTVTKSAVATGADLVAYSGFSTSNYLELPHQSWMEIGTGDFCVMHWGKFTGTTASAFWQLGLSTDDTRDGSILALIVNGDLRLYARGNTGSQTWENTTGFSINDGNWHHFTYIKRGRQLEVYKNGVLEDTECLADRNYTEATSKIRLGLRTDPGGSYSPLTTGSMALWRWSATLPSPEQIKKIYEDEKVLFQAGAQATLYGSSDAVTALAYDDSNGILSVGTSAGRSDFQGLRRVNNTTNAVGAAISASNGLIVEE